ncbi:MULTISPECIES: methyl-accepting chemotaxis protein [unclassified Fusibacter]|uniref:methyl-accepting chemotaxis protein n=1 Tax=unclassified Fusibacter TaxID=2624464 RepID=UPI001013327D|nr:MULTISPECIES: methyl-accepting chemotaxis protein [unclassified Fusibacter]MCK8060358.1 methyl-accepting chemotaxis protein [Fusibacter sp. A2]NPE20353.1 methyl-accepting chemotaxis protein [Fusibacter sp. A1]RXV63559.1 methyl-accepting chemotaxis protein [Fusibacter sp. A1]
MSKSFKFKLALYFGVVILIASLAIGTSVSMLSASKLKSIRNTTSEELAIETTATISNYLASYSRAIYTLSLDSNVKSSPVYHDSMPWMLRTFESFTKAYPEASYIYIGYEEELGFTTDDVEPKLKEFFGNVKIDSDELAYKEAAYNATKGFFTIPHFKAPADYDPSKRGWYALAKGATEPMWTDTYIDAFTGLPIITCAAQVLDDSGKFIGVVSADISLDTIAQTYKDTVVGNTGYLFITDSAGNVIAHPDPAQLGESVQEMEFWSQMSNGTQGYINYSYNGEKKYLYYTTEPNTGWKVAVPFASNEISIDTTPLILSSSLVMVVSVAIGIAIAVYIAMRITKDLNTVNLSLSKVAQGDLTEKVVLSRKDEIGQMGENLNKTIDTLNEIVNEINRTSTAVKHDTDNLTTAIGETTLATEEIARSIQDVAKGTNMQALEVQDGSEKTASVGEKITEVNHLSTEMGNLSDEIKGDSEQGLITMKQLIKKAEEKEQSSEELSTIINSVDAQSKKIGDITNTISSIAQQTNLLALNASIESARAGEAGRGFAVVAEEIRKLAEQSATSSDDIKELIDNMQSQSTTAVKTVDNNRKIDSEEFEAVKKTEQIFNRIFERLNDLLKSIESIKVKNGDIDSDSRALLDVMNNVSSVTEETSAASEEVSASTEEQLASMEEIASQTEHLRQSVEDLHHLILRFKTTV